MRICQDGEPNVVLQETWIPVVLSNESRSHCPLDHFFLVSRRTRPGGVLALLLVATLALSACGGGGGSGNDVGGGDGGGGGGGGGGGSPGQFRFSNTTLAVSEGAAASAILTVERIGGTSGIVSVDVTSADGTATAGLDYTAITTRVSFENGDATAKLVMVPITNDTLGEPDETFAVTLSDPMGGATLPSPENRTATITIHDNDEPGAAILVAGATVKKLSFLWTPSLPNATSYKLMRRASPSDEFVQLGANLAPDVTTTKVDIPVHLYPWAGTVPEYRIDSCNSGGCTPSNIVSENRLFSVLATDYIKASDTSNGAQFGSAVSVSADGKTVAIGAPFENSEAGSVYVYLAPISGPPLAPNPLKIQAPSAQAMHFGASVALSEDGNMLVVGAPSDSNKQTGVGTYPAAPNVDAPHSGGVFVYSRVGNAWSPTPVYVKAVDAEAGDEFGTAVALKDTVLVIGAPRQDRPDMGTVLNTVPDSGAAYVYYANAGTWTLAPHILKATAVANGDLFGSSVAVSRNGSIIIVGAPSKDVAAADSGAGYRFRREDGGATPNWDLGTLLPSTCLGGDQCGAAVAVSADGTVFAVGAPQADNVNNATMDIGAVVLYTSLSPPAIHLESVTALHQHGGAQFGSSLALNGDGTILAVGSPGESASEIGVDGAADAPLTLSGAGSVDVLVRQPGSDWSTAVAHYVKAIVAGAGDRFGIAVGLSNDGNTMVVGANGEDGNGKKIDDNNNPSNDSVADSGAVYLF